MAGPDFGARRGTGETMTATAAQARPGREEPLTVRLEPFTLTVLKKFVRINQSILIEPGNVLRTVDIHKTMAASVRIPQTFPRELVIFELNRLFAALDRFPRPVIEFPAEFPAAGTRIMIRDEKCSPGDLVIHYATHQPHLIVHTTAQKEKKLEAQFGPDDVCFQLSADKLDQLLATAAALALPDVVLIGDGENIVVEVGNLKNLAGTIGVLTIGRSPHKFRLGFPVWRIQHLLPATYDVRVAAGGAITSSQGPAHLAKFESDVGRFWAAANVEGGIGGPR
jgi:hypothetical protein